MLKTLSEIAKLVMLKQPPKAPASEERACAYIRNAVGKRDGFEIGAIVEGVSADARNTVGKRKVCEP